MNKLRIILKGHIFNPLWHSRLARRKVRGRVTSEEISRYCARYVSCGITPSAVEENEGKEKIFSMWLQGEENAPSIVKACLRSIRANCGGREVVVLNEKTLSDYISLPGYVWDKYKAGKIKPAHFSDICRLELLYRYGGLWMDSTDFLGAQLPDWVMKEDFFVYRSGETLTGCYSFVQNCFIRAKKGSYLLEAWRAAVLEYWKKENKTLDYFVHQIIFRSVVEHDTKAKEFFDRMPQIDQDPTHYLWYFGGADSPFDKARFDSVCGNAAFQKTDYKCKASKDPVPGSFSDVMQKMYL